MLNQPAAQVRFQAISEQWPGEKWRGLFDRHWAAYQEWFLSAGDDQRPSYLECYRNFKHYMPELLPLYEHLCELSGGQDSAARFLSMYRPPPYLSGCSQAVWSGEENFLIRNYDYSPSLLEGTLFHSQWLGSKVMATSDCLWGVVDGMNDSGLVVSLTFGGRQEVGDGFGVPIVLRYVLETCRDVQDAVAALKKVPTHMSYNITVLDKDGHFRTVFLAPDREPVVRRIQATTNHQEQVEWQQHADATGTLEREKLLFNRLANSWETPERFVQRFMEAPLYSQEYWRGFGTLYTAIYRPTEGTVQLVWPQHAWTKHFGNFLEGSQWIRYVQGTAPG